MASKYSNRRTPEERYAFWHNENGERRCSHCEQHKPLDQFNVDKTGPSGRSFYCKVCASAKSRKHHHRRKETDPEYLLAKKTNYLKWKFGISLDEYKRRLAKQDHTCAICHTKEPNGGWHLDHDHATGQLRDFLCCTCNAGLGYMKDSPEILRAAAIYLERHRQQAQPAKEL